MVSSRHLTSDIPKSDDIIEDIVIESNSKIDGLIKKRDGNMSELTEHGILSKMSIGKDPKN
jgi:hypothetical protein